MRNKQIFLAMGLMITGMLAVFALTACSDDDDISLPTFSEITVSPARDVYHVGDKVTCTIHRQTTGSETLKGYSYWWYTSWWFPDPDQKADFESSDTAGTCTSAEIELTKAGDVTLYFFGQLQYPKWDYRKVEIGKTLHVEN